MAFSRTSIPKKESRSSLASSPELLSLSKQTSQRSWVDKNFHKRECIKFISSHRDPNRCCCGRNEIWHSQHGVPRLEKGVTEKWHPFKHTNASPTDAYGTIEFQGGPHPSKAQYMRLSSLDSRQENVLTLLIKHWGLDLPKLLITVHGGILNFDLQPKLKRVFRKGLLKAARTTGAWIITNGTNTGVTRHVGDAISDRTTKARNKVVAIGIAPWGIVENKEDLIGRDIVVPYHCVSSTKANTSVLNSNHSYFLLADNGTTGKYGGEILFRKKFEKYIAQQKICIANDFRGHGVPVICVVLEGGANTIRSVLEYVTDTPPVPVVVCDGSGRAADLLAFTHKYTMDDGTMAESLRDQLILTIERTFQYNQEQAEKLFIELMLCVKKKELITVFRMGDREESKDIDLAILTALLKGTTANAIDQLNLALTWDRVDIARSHIFVYGQEWPEGALEVAMMDALINDRVDFVKLLLENGVSMQTFLSIPRLEDLYNTVSRQGPSNTLRYLVRDIKKHVPSNYRYTLPDIGQVLQHLMGGGFRAYYCRKRFRQKYHALKQTSLKKKKKSASTADFKGTSVGNIVTSIPHLMNTKPVEELFPYPFHDLMIWAVLMKRQKMALFMWQHGEEALAKSLLAGRLYSAMAHEADQDDLEIELSQEFRSYADEFLNLALELLEHCYKIDDDYTQQLLTYELKNFSEQTCLGLAVNANHRRFIAHTCCQVLLNDLWIGGLRMRKNTSLKVILGIVFPPYIFALEFKSKEELQLMPQTMEEHLDELEDAQSVADMSISSFSEDVDYNNYNEDVEPSVTRDPSLKENGAIGAGVASSNGNAGMDTSIFSHMPFRKKKSPLRMGKKVYEFYRAPVTKFWAHAIGYMTFLTLYCYVILDRLKLSPTWAEYYVTACVATMALEKIRQIIASEPVKLSMKLRVYICQLWNILDTLGITTFLAGLVLRTIPYTIRDAQLVYTVCLIFWNIRILEILSVNKYLGPYVKIIGKLLRDMCYFLTILFIAVTSFGMVRQSVHFQNQDVSWHMKLRNVWYYPYWMIYGELFAEEIDPCDLGENQDASGLCTLYASWLAPFLMFVFLLVANILMVNLLIARFNATFIRNNANSKEIWMFQRYALILQYEMRPVLPPPFIIITHVYLAFKFIKRKIKGKRDFYDNGLKLFLSHEDTEKLHDFEEECMEDLYREKELKFHNSSEERIRIINERVENMSLRLDDMNVKENHLRLTLANLDHRMSRIDEVGDSLLEAVRLLTMAGHAKSDMGSQDSLSESHYPHTLSGGSSIEGHPRTMSVSSVERTDRNQPSPMLVHSKRKTHSDQLKKFTNANRRRQLSGSDFPIEETDHFVGEGADLSTPHKRKDSLSSHHGRRDSTSSHGRKDSIKTAKHTTSPVHSMITSHHDAVHFTIGATALETETKKSTPTVEHIFPEDEEEKQPPSPVPVTSSEDDENINKSLDSLDELSHKQKMRNFASQSVRFVDPVVHSFEDKEAGAHPSQPAIDVTAKLDTDTHTVSQLPEVSVVMSSAQQDTPASGDRWSPYEEEPEDQFETPELRVDESGSVQSPVSPRHHSGRNSLGKLIFTGQPLTINTSMSQPPVVPFVPISMPQSSACFTTQNPVADSIPQSAARDLSSMLNPLISEYTSITDTIDTSCIEECSPPRSPTSASGFVFGDYKDVEAKMKEPSVAEVKQQALKQAEETEHQRMENLIRHRLRQISQDESGSISDIAKVVVAELAAEKQKLDEEEEEEVEMGETEDSVPEDLEETLYAIAATSPSLTGSREPSTTQQPSVSDVEDEVTEETRLLFRDRVRIRISQPSQDTVCGDNQSLSKFQC